MFPQEASRLLQQGLRGSRTPNSVTITGDLSPRSRERGTGSEKFPRGNIKCGWVGGILPKPM